MKRSMSGRADVEPERPEPAASEDEAAQLLARFREGDRAAGYELLGRQATHDQWKAVLSALAADPNDVDLERIAGSTIGRHPEVVTFVLDLLEREGGAR